MTTSLETAPRHLPAFGRIGREAAVWISAVAIMAATVLISVFSPDLVTGSDQQHLPLAALLTWPWAGTAMAYVLLAGRGRSTAWPALASTVASVWLGAAVAAIFGPVLVTGTDPTRIPLTALAAPLVAMVVTGFACLAATTGTSDR